MGMSVEEVHAASKIDPWFLDQFAELIATEKKLETGGLPQASADWRFVKAQGFSDKRLAKIAGKTELEVRAARRAAGVRPAYKRIDTCAAEFASPTPYMYSTYETECEAAPSAAKKIIILGGGPNRIGQGIEFDYSCVHGVMAAKECGYETIMINCNPETVSTDFNTADKLYFEPVFWEHIYDIIKHEKPEGVIVQLGGQTALKLAEKLDRYGIKVI
eukprot:gene11103-14107_t